jgi:DNA polymerase III epsilon subunit-like protein
VAPEAEVGFAALELCERAFRFVTEHGTATEEVLLTHVYGGAIPVALRARLAAPLMADARLERSAEGRWSVHARRTWVEATSSFTALALVASGPTPARARLVRISAERLQRSEVLSRFDATLNPQRHVPLYVAQRAGISHEVLDLQPLFADIVDDLLQFLGQQPILAQDVQLTWAFVAAELRRLGRHVVDPPLVDLNQLAQERLELSGKPALALVAAQLGISSVHITQPDEEARVVGRVGAHLLAVAASTSAPRTSERATLRRGATARALPDEPGVYVLRDQDQRALYVGKARRLRSRLAAYVHRPLGATRRLEGLVANVETVESSQCQTDLEALILEDREIRRLQPRFNTVRQLRMPRLWIHLPPQRTSARGKFAPPRLELSTGRGLDSGEFVGPFRNQMLAEQARRLAREVFELDELRRTRSPGYIPRLEQAWQFLHGEMTTAEPLARKHSLPVLRKVLAFDLASMLLPADPLCARYAVLRPSPAGVEGFLLDRAVLMMWTVLEDNDTSSFAARLLEAGQPRTEPQDSGVVLRWFGAQRPPGRLVWLPDDDVAATDAIQDALAAPGG